MYMCACINICVCMVVTKVNVGAFLAFNGGRKSMLYLLQCTGQAHK